MKKADEALQLTAVKLKLDLHPSRTNDIVAGVCQQLDLMLMRYHEQFDAVLLAYFDVSVVGTKAPILISLPYITLDVKTSMMFFRPQVGASMLGVVNKVGVDHIGLLVLGAFNASIALEQTAGAFEEHVSEHQCWSATDNHRHRISEGDTVRFIITARRETGGVVSLQGEIGKDGTGNVNHVVASKSRKKSRGREENEAGGVGGEMVTPRKKKHKIGKASSTPGTETLKKEKRRHEAAS